MNTTIKKIIGLFGLTCHFIVQIAAQHQEISEIPLRYKKVEKTKSDSGSLLAAFRKGTVNGHFRYFFMATDNTYQLTDYYANALGGGLRYETANFHGFNFALSGFYVFNIGSSNLSTPDSITGLHNRYEIGLFDIENPKNKNDINRLEELHLKYRYKKTQLVLGKQLINTAFINLQDGRMKPTTVSGIWLTMKDIKNLKLETGWLYSISPRSTTGWFQVDESIGVYSQGVNADGNKSNYAGNLHSAGVFIIGAHYKIGQQYSVSLLNQFTENIFNSLLLEATATWQMQNKSSQIYAALMAIRQDAVNAGGNLDPQKTYFEKGEKSQVVSIKAGWKNKHWDAGAHFTRITAHGRYLMPREWGRDPFYTFIPRERNEGLGDVQAVTGKLQYRLIKLPLTLTVTGGYFSLPDVQNYRLNKYGMPSYIHLNAEATYKFSGKLQGFEAQLLVVDKINKGETYQNYKYEINKVNMLHYTFVLNYFF